MGFPLRSIFLISKAALARKRHLRRVNYDANSWVKVLDLNKILTGISPHEYATKPRAVQDPHWVGLEITTPLLYKLTSFQSFCPGAGWIFKDK